MQETKLFSLNAFATAAGLDRRTVTKRMEPIEPTAIQGKARLYPLSILLRACVIDIARVYLPDVTPAEGETLTEAKTRKESALASLHELELAEKTGTLLQVDHALDYWTRIITNTKQRLLCLPTKVAPLIVGCKSVAQAHDILKNHLYDAMTELSNNPLPDQPEQAHG